MKESTADIQFESCGSMAVVQALTQPGRYWVQSKLSFEPWQVVGDTGVAVDHRMVPDLRQQALEDRLVVTR